MLNRRQSRHTEHSVALEQSTLLKLPRVDAPKDKRLGMLLNHLNDR